MWGNSGDRECDIFIRKLVQQDFELQPEFLCYSHSTLVAGMPIHPSGCMHSMVQPIRCIDEPCRRAIIGQQNRIRSRSKTCTADKDASTPPDLEETQT